MTHTTHSLSDSQTANARSRRTAARKLREKAELMTLRVKQNPTLAAEYLDTCREIENLARTIEREG